MPRTRTGTNRSASNQIISVHPLRVTIRIIGNAFMAEQGGDKIKKMTALLLAIFFALSILGCATTQDKAKLDEQIDTMKKREEAQMWQRATGP